MTHKHTPTPWGYNVDAITKTKQTPNGLMQEKICYGVKNTYDAEFITRACNNHYELLEALEDLLQAWNGEQVFTFEHWADAEKAIKKAKGES